MSSESAVNVVLAGLPRSGSTLTCSLLNKVENTVALHEPMDVVKFAQFPNPEALSAHIHAWFNATRESLLRDGTAVSKHVDGVIPDNPVHIRPDESGLRKSRISRGTVRFDKPLTSTFSLVVKHCAGFSALLPVLVKTFPCYATVRNPLATLASWNSVDMNVWHGRVPAAEHLDTHLSEALDRITDRLERQFYVLSWLFERYVDTLPKERILPYERTVSTGGKALSVITPAAQALAVELRSKNVSEDYSKDVVLRLGERLLKTEGAYWEIYARQDVESLLVYWEALP